MQCCFDRNRKKGLKVLVTGASGYLGQFVTDMLAAEGYTVRGPHLPDSSPSQASEQIQAHQNIAQYVSHRFMRRTTVKEVNQQARLPQA